MTHLDLKIPILPIFANFKNCLSGGLKICFISSHSVYEIIYMFTFLSGYKDTTISRF